ncbi:MAG TPA: DUF5695 domain-containing protein [Xanthobacteraceae bacterium]|nr:DUF5695 domain-containing protein [Xanthobacteraceae bacterium]
MGFIFAIIRPARPLLAALLLLPAIAGAQSLRNSAFNVQYSDEGIISLRRTNDVADTEYIASGGSLGRVVARYRTSPQAEWRDISQLTLAGEPTANRIQYRVGELLKTLAAQSQVSASATVPGLATVNDGAVVPSFGGRGGRGAPPAIAAIFQGGAEGGVQWIQYAFPGTETVSEAAVYWSGPGDNPVGGRGGAQAPPATSTQAPRSWRILYKAPDNEWRPVQATTPYGNETSKFNEVKFTTVSASAMRVEFEIAPNTQVGVAEWRVGPERTVVLPQDLNVSESFQFEGDQLNWTITLANNTAAPIEVGDLAVPTRMAEGTPGRRGDIYTQKLLRHSLIAGNGSWLYWARSNGVGPYLLMTTVGATKLEYFDNTGGFPADAAGRGGRGGFTPYIHATVNNAADIQRAREAGRQQPWRLPLTSLHLSPQGSKGSEVTYQFRLQWVPNFQGVRDALYADNQFDTVVVPGMTVPTDLPAMIALRTRNHIDAVEAEFPAKTSVQYVGKKSNDTYIYKVKFDKLGENMLKVRYGDKQWTSLEFFVTEPLETVIKKREKFLVEKMQHMDSSKPWYGAYGDWDQLKQALRNPEDRDRLSPWLTDSSDDAGNARPAFVAGVNAFFPTPEGVASVERYVRYYLFNDYKDGKGGMQMTEKEAYPYGIYGTFDNWWQHRAAPDTPPDTYEPGNPNRQRDWTVLHRDHLWRIYDYPHIINMYHRLYQIGKYYPEMLHWKTSAQYLELAYRTAVAYWTAPFATRNWSANSVGTMNEACIEDLIYSLEEEGKQEWANELRALWETKVAHFVLNTPNLYGSEFAFDSTGFESTEAFARYAVRNAGKRHVDPPRFAVGPGRGEIPKFSDITPEAARKFQDFQMRLNVNDRGWIETAYYLLGSDYRGSTSYLQSYMSHLGGWSVLDYGLNFTENPTDYLRLGYASALSAWCLVNSGTAESGYGYWYPAKANDGATAGGFVPEVWGRGWIGKTMPRGAWHYSAEEDVGYVGALRTHATVVVNDPVFGDYAYGGILTRAGDGVRVIARDGLRMRLHVIRNQQRLHLLFDNDGFAAEQPITISDDLRTIAFRVENRAKRPHDTHMRISGMPSGNYAISVNGSPVSTFSGSDQEQIVRVPLPSGEDAAVSIARR